MTKPVTEEMISALIDGELSPADQALAEKAISIDEKLRQFYDSCRETSHYLRESSEFVQSTVGLPPDFASRVMDQVETLDDVVQSEARTDVGSQKPVQSADPVGVSAQQKISGRSWSQRTWLEIIAASVALVVIVLVWQRGSGTTQVNGSLAKSNVKGMNSQSAENGNSSSGTNKPDVQALGSENLTGKTGSKTPENTNNKAPAVAAVQSTREFSVFVKDQTRPSIDRFWITNDYEVTAPEGTSPTGDGGPVNVLLIDAKKMDVVKFFSQLSKWDPEFRVFQHRKSGTASWLAPFDVAEVNQTEGDFWKLQIVLIRP